MRAGLHMPIVVTRGSRDCLTPSITINFTPCSSPVAVARVPSISKADTARALLNDLPHLTLNAVQIGRITGQSIVTMTEEGHVRHKQSSNIAEAAHGNMRLSL
jgi:hypothetical protein